MEGKKDTVNKVIMECTVNSGIISPTLYYPIKKKKKSYTRQTIRMSNNAAHN